LIEETVINLGEMVIGLRVIYKIDRIGRGIVSALKMRVLKKLRGQITAVCRAEIPITHGIHQLVVISKLYDKKRDLVAEIEAHWEIEIYDSIDEL
jgi:hypothetical protein